MTRRSRHVPRYEVWHRVVPSHQPMASEAIAPHHRLLKLKRVVAMIAPKRMRKTKPTRMSTHQPRMEYLYPK